MYLHPLYLEGKGFRVRHSFAKLLFLKYAVGDSQCNQDLSNKML